MKPDIPWIIENRVRLHRRYDSLRGSVEKDGFKWKTRGIHDSYMTYSGHEDYLRQYLLTGGNMFVDVGAHAGRWTLRASRIFTQVIAFEPTIRTARHLEQNLVLNNVQNVTVENIALGEKEDWGTMFYFPFFRSDGGNSLFWQHPFNRKPGKFVNKVNIRTLDSYNLSPTVLKIDTEGYELHVLEGAVQTLKRTLRIVVEIHPPENLEPATRILHDAGFITKVHREDPRLHPEVHLIGDRAGS